MCGLLEDCDDKGTLVGEGAALRFELKYPQLNRWHIERWLPPEAYGSPRFWHQQTLEVCGARSIPALRPYPSRRDYEHVFTLESPPGAFVQLTPTLAHRIAPAIRPASPRPPFAPPPALDPPHPPAE